jgi:hypothetical protein
MEQILYEGINGAQNFIDHTDFGLILKIASSGLRDVRLGSLANEVTLA